MWKAITLAVVAVAAFVCLAGEQADPTWRDPDVSVPQVDAVKSSVRLPKAAVVLNLTRNGEIKVEKRAVSLNTLKKWLQKKCLAVDGHQLKPAEKSHLGVILHVDARAPWRHVQWITEALASEHVGDIYWECRSKEGKVELSAKLEAEPISSDPTKPPPTVYFADIEIQGGQEMREDWGPVGGRKKVLVPGLIHYVFGAQRTTERDRVVSWISALKRGMKDPRHKEVKCEFRAKISAGPRVPFGNVALLLSLYNEEGLIGPLYLDSAPATPEHPDAVSPALPYPSER